MRKMIHAFRVLSFLALLLSLNACIRYTPSLEGEGEVRDEQGQVINSEEVFYKFERRQEERLRTLVRERLLIQAEQGQAESTAYRIGPGDQLEFSVFDVEELNTKVRVRPSGEIVLPLLGPMMVKGLTEGEVQSLVQERLTEYVHSPQVTLFISEYGAHKISVIGAVARPGTYMLKRGDYSLIELLSEAGGRTDNASGRIVLIPARKGLPARQSFALAALSSAENRNDEGNGIEIFFDDLVGSVDKPPLAVPLRSGDTIVVPEAGKVQVDGDVKKPGSYALSSRMTLMGAIASSGGLTFAADVHKVELIRELGTGQKAMIVKDLEQLAAGNDEDVRLRDGDVVRVPSASGRFVAQQIINGLNSIFNIGIGGRI